jgi:hypothetical protein
MFVTPARLAGDVFFEGHEEAGEPVSESQDFAYAGLRETLLTGERIE